VLIAMGVCPQCGGPWDEKGAYLNISTVIPQTHCGCLRGIGISYKPLPKSVEDGRY